jgi:hypothetical protein
MVELRGIEIDCRRRRRQSRHCHRRLADGQRIMDHGSHLGRVAMAADVHIEGSRAGTQQMIVHGGDLQAAFDHLQHDGVDLALEQDEIAHHHGFPMHRLERDPTAERQARFDVYAVKRHGEVAARKAIAAHVTRNRRFPAERVVDLLPVDFLRVSGGHERFRENLPIGVLRACPGGGGSRENRNHKPKDDTHLVVLPVLIGSGQPNVPPRCPLPATQWRSLR